MSTMTSLGALRLRALALLALVFVAGGFAGAGLFRFVEIRRPHRPPPFVAMGPYAQLGLSAAQEARVREIFARHRAELEAIVHETMPKVRAIQDAIDEEMKSVLTAEQRHKLDEIKAAAPLPPPEVPGMSPPPPPPPAGPGGPLGPPREPPPAPPP